MLDVLIVVLTLANLGILLHLSGVLKLPTFSRKTYDEHVAESADELAVGEHLTIQEHILLREKAMDDRIREMKEELAKQNAKNIKSNLSDAQELDPNVRNLPHDIITSQGTFKGVEVAE